MWTSVWPIGIDLKGNVKGKEEEPKDICTQVDMNIDKTSSDINHINVFLGQSPKAIEIKPKINKWDLIKHESFSIAKETIKKMKKQSTEWEKIFANGATDKALISKTYK